MLIGFGVSVVALPFQLPFSAVYLRMAYAIDMRLAPPPPKQETPFAPEVSWGKAFANVALVGVTVLVVGFFLSLMTQIGANIALMAPTITVIVVMLEMLLLSFVAQAVLNRIVLKVPGGRAVRISLYQILITLLVVALIGGVVIGLMRVI